MAFHTVVNFLFFTWVIINAQFSDDDEMHPDYHLNITQMIQKYGYPVETHEVTTEDGYIITIFRIPHSKDKQEYNKKPVFIMHGLFCTSEHFVIGGMYNASLPFLLADNGYDVWLGNSRGTRHGRRHKSLDPRKKTFWDFSWNEIGMYDLPAFMDYVLEKTKSKKLFYIGHSQGGTSFYIMTSMKPQYQDKIVLASLLAPAGYFNNFKNPFIMPLVRMLDIFVGMIDTFYELPPRYFDFGGLTSGICEVKMFSTICHQLYDAFTGYGSGEVPKILVPMFLKHVPNTSTRQSLHYGQEILSGHFRPWDYGRKRNMKLYNSDEPPDYPIRNITVPIAIYYSLGDTLVYPKDIHQMCKDLPNCVRKFLIKQPKYSHFDFMYAYNINKLQNIPLLEYMNKYDIDEDVVINDHL